MDEAARVVEQTARPGSEDPAAETDQQAFLEGVVASTLEPVVGGLAVLFLAIALVQRFAMEPPFPDLMAPYSLAMSLLMGGLYVWARSRGIPPRWAHAAGTGLVLLVLTGTVLPFALVQDPLQTTDLVLLAMGAGAVFVSRRWYLLNLALLVGVFGTFVALNPGYARWPNLGVAVMSGSVIGYVVLRHRARLLASLHGLRAQDARQRRELEERMERIQELRAQAEAERDRAQRYADQLEATNEDLQRFAGTLSRHLGSPVRRARRTLAEGPEPGEDGAPVPEARRELRQLESTLDALLEYVDLAARGRDLEVLELEDVVVGTWKDVADDEGVEVGELAVGSLPEVVADEELLTRALRELLENALRHGAPPVQVRARHEGGAVRLVVEDHGPGVAPDDRDRIFRLLEGDDPARPGMGLAICRRAAQRMGGDVVLDPGREDGARFVVTLQAVGRIQAADRGSERSAPGGEADRTATRRVGEQAEA